MARLREPGEPRIPMDSDKALTKTTDDYREKGNGAGDHQHDAHDPYEGVAYPKLLVNKGNLSETAKMVAALLARANTVFDNGVPVSVVAGAYGDPPVVRALTKHGVVTKVHDLSCPVQLKGVIWEEVTLPVRVADMYLDDPDGWKLPKLGGISFTPVLTDDGKMRCVEGYDPESRLWCMAVPELSIPDNPTMEEARESLLVLRGSFKTFPFADSKLIKTDVKGIKVVDTSVPPGMDESAFLVGLMTAACRASLWLAPGLIISAAVISGAGTGKGKLIRAICAIAHGVQPRAFTAGNDRHELDKRLVAELIEAAPALFLDNVNSTLLRSQTLASVMTERPARVRLLGQSKMVELNSAAFIAVTGNGLNVSEDLARRFVVSKLDAQVEAPESREFEPGFDESIAGRRAVLLAAVLTIWRWGRQNRLKAGKPLGSYERWAQWCRDPLLALGCLDPVERIGEIKAEDPQRRHVSEIFEAWWAAHKSKPTKVTELDPSVKELADPQNRGRQWLARYVQGLAGTRTGGFVLTVQKGTKARSIATYALKRTDETPGEDLAEKDAEINFGRDANAGHAGHASSDPLHDPHDPHDCMGPSQNSGTERRSDTSSAVDGEGPSSTSEDDGWIDLESL